MKVFISYLTADRFLAGSIKEELDANGFETFLAHEDIQPTQIWMDKIFQNLIETDIVLTLLTKDFSQSIWCNQEIGIGLALNKLMVPIKIDQDPVGFLSKYQALKYGKDEKFPVTKLLGIISASENLGADYRNFLIEVLSDSTSFIDSGRNAKRIIDIKDFTTEQLERIMKVSISNNQIYHGVIARKTLLNYMYDYRKNIDQNMYEQFRKKLGDK